MTVSTSLTIGAWRWVIAGWTRSPESVFVFLIDGFVFDCRSKGFGKPARERAAIVSVRFEDVADSGGRWPP